MKDFDFVKLTLWIAGALTIGLAALYFWLGLRIDKVNGDIKRIEGVCKTVGLLAKDIKTLVNEKKNDKTPDTSAGIHSFFMTQAQNSGIRVNEDYTLKTRDPEQNKKIGYVDEQFTIDFKKDRPHKRKNIFSFIYNCETQSRRIKLTKAKLTLDPDMAVQDLWRADSLTFVRRDPLRGATEAN